MLVHRKRPAQDCGHRNPSAKLRVTEWAGTLGLISVRIFHRQTHILSMESKTTPNLSPKQGQYLAFIYYYTKLNRQAPAEADFQRFFLVSSPSVHDMIVKLDESGFISREPGQSRSIRLLVDREHIPDLD